MWRIGNKKLNFAIAAAFSFLPRFNFHLSETSYAKLTVPFSIAVSGLLGFVGL